MASMSRCFWPQKSSEIGEKVPPVGFEADPAQRKVQSLPHAKLGGCHAPSLNAPHGGQRDGSTDCRRPAKDHGRRGLAWPTKSTSSISTHLSVFGGGAVRGPAQFCPRPVCRSASRKQDPIHQPHTKSNSPRVWQQNHCPASCFMNLFTNRVTAWPFRQCGSLQPKSLGIRWLWESDWKVRDSMVSFEHTDSAIVQTNQGKRALLLGRRICESGIFHMQKSAKIEQHLGTCSNLKPKAIPRQASHS